MTIFDLISGQTVSGLVVSAGTDLEIGSGGTAIGTLVKDGGSESVFSGGVTTSTTIHAGGYEFVSAGGMVSGTAVKDGGYLVLGAGGTAIGASVSGGGTMIVSAGGAAINTVSAAAADLFITDLVTSGEVASGVTITSSSVLDVGSGGLALQTTVAGGGTELVSAGGIASATVVSSGATLEVLAGGSAVNPTILSGGTYIVLSGGAETGAVVGSGGTASVTLTVGSGQVSSGLAANAYTSVYVLRGGTTSGSVVASGGTEIVSALGTAIGTTVQSGGFDLISGVSVSAVVSGEAVIRGGIVSGLTVTGDGSVAVVAASLSESVVSDATISGEGTLSITSFAQMSGSVVFGGEGGLVISGATMPFATLSGFTSANTLDLAGVAFAPGGAASFSDGSLVVTETGGTYVLEMAGTYSGDAFSVGSDDAGGTLVTVADAPPCFLGGTLIGTPEGEVAVERLAIGDLVLTEDGGVASIVWIGSRRIDCRRHADARLIWPIRIRAGAFAPKCPQRDLFLSPDHAVFAAGVLIPVKHLVDGRSIRQMPADEVTYFHLELAEHAAVLAEGLAVESYLDTGDRGAFAEAPGVRMLHPAFGSERADVALVTEALGFAPLRVTGPQVEQVRARLARRGAEEAEAEARAGKRHA